ncbi:hypothetical protein [Siphonobacter aquaeclarae]|uniref:Uncharacterized protein n=1 Tax=Siphonobacter aquaeclarae TaxID=563176 RepID=A0A1G9HNC1_9BACT|nr:hypothetical protein [Siphonobacter aquaeclarae]SDL14487.1 hypothetical protein SAMN04488090_0136 [Siphonobacter aquaeclarae]
MKLLCSILLMIVFSSQVSGQRRLELPFGLAFGMSPEQVTEAMKKLDIEEEPAMLAEYRFFSHVPVGHRFATVNAIFNEKTLVLESLIEAFEESDDPLLEYDSMRVEAGAKYGKSTTRKRLDRETFSAQEDWQFDDGVLTLSLAKSGVSLIFDKALPKKKKR